ncbi:hypothetical protein SCP_1103800 [Sparassis crispa]|uniref:Uncharacterized protein n=1 Tax=Sparassis crispa TaxID=139825 RepID=A0A401GZW4_9APHY|nr:hypothetical protein SCP_1103800 [Sparassis crispa]GBE87703.1 hypothetical protein SCP_1103800 [Sparassis crispa]
MSSRSVSPMSLIRTSWDIYTDEVLKLGYGYPLWHPPSDVHIGDVGFMSKGGFYRLFNAFEDKDHPLNKPYTLKDFIPFSYDASKLRRQERAIPEDHLCSPSIKISRAADLPGTYRVECARNEKGAFLFFKDAVCEEILPHEELTEYIQANWKSWLEISGMGMELDAKDLVFVRGHIKTSDWALSANDSAERCSTAVVQEQSSKDASTLFVIVMNNSFMELRYGPLRKASTDETDSGRVEHNQCLFLLCVLLDGVAEPERGSSSPSSPQEQNGYDADGDVDLKWIP